MVCPSRCPLLDDRDLRKVCNIVKERTSEDMAAAAGVLQDRAAASGVVGYAQ